MNDVTVLEESLTSEGIKVMYVQPCNAVCSRQIGIAIKDDTIYEVVFAGGCKGNTTGIAKLCEGMKVEDVIERLEGIDCGGKGTSCPDQLAKALRYALSKDK